jgi:dienelactone hydrolase
MVGRLSVPDGDGKRPAVLILHAGSGIDEFALGKANQLAELGYVALAADYHGDGREITNEEMFQRCRHDLGANPERSVSIMTAGLEVLFGEKRTDRSKVVAIGYCYGGTLALELGRSGEDVKAIVAFHAGLTTSRPDASAQIRGPVLVCTGSDDPNVPVDQRHAFEEEMSAAGVDWQMLVFGGVQHAFTNQNAARLSAERGLPGLKYDARADRRSWKAMLDLFDDVLR